MDEFLLVPAALVYENLDNCPQSSWDLAAVALLSTRAAQHALTELAAHHLAVRDRDGWRRGPVDPTQLARTLGADELVATQVARYRTERTAWQTRLGAYPTPSISELFSTPPGPAEPHRPAPTWRPQQPQPPPEAQQARATRSDRTDPSSTDLSSTGPALELVLQVLGGTVL